MSDIVERLRTWTHSVHAVPASDVLDEAADEIERLRSAYATAIHCLADNAERLRLTEAELKAVQTAAFAYAQNDEDDECAEIASVLLGLAERFK